MIRLEYGAVDNWKLIGTNFTEEEVWQAIQDYLEQLNFKSYYMRMWKTEDSWTIIDYGSHTRFFRKKEELK